MSSVYTEYFNGKNKLLLTLLLVAIEKKLESGGLKEKMRKVEEFIINICILNVIIVLEL